MRYELARRYGEGEGVLRYLGEYTLCYRMAAEQGYAEAQNSLAELHWLDTGVGNNLVEALRPHKLASKQEHTQFQAQVENIQVLKGVPPRTKEEHTLVEETNIIYLSFDPVDCHTEDEYDNESDKEHPNPPFPQPSMDNTQQPTLPSQQLNDNLHQPVIYPTQHNVYLLQPVPPGPLVNQSSSLEI